jgi:hypothetical protein
VIQRRSHKPFVWRLVCLGAAAAITVVAACTEKLNGGAGCAQLCPGQAVTVVDTIYRLDSMKVVFDTTVQSYPQLGSEPALLVSNAIGLQDVRAVVRFDDVADSVGVAYTHLSGTDTITDSTPIRPITAVDTAVLFFLVNPKSVKPNATGDSVLFQVYDVDAPGVDSVVAQVAAQFTALNLVGQTMANLGTLADTTDTTDTVRVAISRASVLAHIKGDRNLRYGIKIVHSGAPADPVRLWIENVASGSGPKVYYRVHYDTFPGATDSTLQSPSSNTPASDPALASQLKNYPVFVLGSPPTQPTVLDVGGLPARRVYLKFNIATRIVDSTNVVRATLRLKQIPHAQVFPTDSVAVWPTPVVSASIVTDPAKAALFTAASSIWNMDSTLTQPQDTGIISLEIAGAFRAWHQISDTTTVRAIVLQVQNEGANPIQGSFYSSFAADTSKRPHLEIRYVRQSTYLLP